MTVIFQYLTNLYKMSEKKFPYKPGETIGERLRNKISCLTTIIHILGAKKENKMLLKEAEESLSDIRLLLEDADLHCS